MPSCPDWLVSRSSKGGCILIEALRDRPNGLPRCFDYEKGKSTEKLTDVRQSVPCSSPTASPHPEFSASALLRTDMHNSARLWSLLLAHDTTAGFKREGRQPRSAASSSLQHQADSSALLNATLRIFAEEKVLLHIKRAFLFNLRGGTNVVIQVKPPDIHLRI